MQSSRPPKGIATLLEHLSALEDRRVTGRCHYSLQTVVIGLLDVLCGAEGWVDLETFARSKQGWLREFLDLPPEPPKEGVFRRVFSSLRPAVFEACFRSLAQTLARVLPAEENRVNLTGPDGGCRVAS